MKALKHYVKIEKEILQQIYEIAKNLTRNVEDWGYGDFYPQIIEEKVFNDNLCNAMKNALNDEIITDEQQEYFKNEYEKCLNDKDYFIQNYCKFIQK